MFVYIHSAHTLRYYNKGHAWRMGISNSRQQEQFTLHCSGKRICPGENLIRSLVMSYLADDVHTKGYVFIP